MSVVGIDYGTKRIGVAYSASRELASPYEIIPNPGDPESAASRIAAIGAELEAELFILGVPRGNRHDAAAITARFEQLADLIRQKSCTEVVLWDESHSTVEAQALRADRGRKRGSRREDIDHEAAAVILQSWLDHERRKSS